MNATPPEAKSEYSRGSRVSRGRFGPAGSVSPRFLGLLPLLILLTGMAGALLLIIAEFTPLFHVHVQATGIAVKSTRTGPHHAYAMAVIGVCAAALSIAALTPEESGQI